MRSIRHRASLRLFICQCFFDESFKALPVKGHSNSLSQRQGRALSLRSQCILDTPRIDPHAEETAVTMVMNRPSITTWHP
jgi:hypothetical protein